MLHRHSPARLQMFANKDRITGLTERRDFNLVFASAEGLVNLADPKELTLWKNSGNKLMVGPQVQGVIRNLQDQLKKK